MRHKTTWLLIPGRGYWATISRGDKDIRESGKEEDKKEKKEDEGEEERDGVMDCNGT